ncbi:putative ribonuclease H-like domain-containing protein [Tanacetum coccineum]
MMAIFHDMIEKTMEVFMDDFSVFGDSFSSCLSNLDNMLKRCKDTNLVLNWEKCHFMCREGIVLGHKISKSGIEVDRAKVDVIAKLPHPTTVKGVRSFLGHASFYRRFIQDFSKIARPMTHLLEKETPFMFSKDCIAAFETLKKKLTEAPILVVPDWNLPFELMCDDSDFAIGAVLGQRKTKHFQPIHYARKTMTKAQIHYTTTEKEMLAVVYAFEKAGPSPSPKFFLRTFEVYPNDGPNFKGMVIMLIALLRRGHKIKGQSTARIVGKISQDGKKIVPDQEYILLPLLTSDLSLSKSSKAFPDAGFKPSGEEENMDSEHLENKDSEVPNTEEPRVHQEQDVNVNSTNNINTICPTVNAADIENNAVDKNIVYGCIDDPSMPNLEEIVYSDDDEEVGVETDMNNLATTVLVSPILTTRVHKDHPLEQIIRDIHLAPQTRRMKKSVTEHEATHDELLQFKLQKVWTLVDLPYGKRAIGTKWMYRNKKDDRVARIEVIRLFLAYASFMNFTVYQMDVNSAFLYGTIEEEVYVCQPSGFEDPEFPNKVYKVEKALYGLHQAPKAWYKTLSTYLLENGFRRGTIDKTLFIKKDKDDILLVQVYVDDIIFGSTKKSLCTEFEHMMHKRFQMSSMGERTFFLGLQVKQKDDGIFISQDKYVADILKKFDFATVKTASTPMETNKALLKDEEAADVDVYLYRSMIGSLMYLTASRPDIMFAVCACVRFQVTQNTSHLHAVKRIFRYLKGHPKLGLWYPRDSPFDLEAFSDSDYAGASLDRKSTTGEYVAAANCCGQVLWTQNQLLDYGYNFMNTKIYIDNESTICIGYLEWNGTTAKDEFQVSAVRVTYYWQVYLMLLSINLLLPVLVYAARHSLTAVRHKLMLPDITSYC